MIQVFGRPLVVDVLAVVDFDSNRKRSSTLCRYKCNSAYRYVLYCKGADSTVLSLVKSTNSEGNENKHIDAINSLQTFASQGLRTLCIAKRDLTESEALDWLQTYKEASSLIEGREQALEM